MSYSVSFSGKTVHYYFDEGLQLVDQLMGERKAVFITDSNVHSLYREVFDRFNTIVIPAGEASKSLESLSFITEQLIRFEADRNTLIVGVGGGVVTDITGFAASVYMRGVKFGFIPATLLAMVDAAIGGKNGVDFRLHKNMLGTISQPEFLLFDLSFLQTLPSEEWSNGFAEVIKYGCIFDSFLFDRLVANDMGFFRNDPQEALAIIQKCVDWKNKVVQEDETEQGNRKLLNFGHTAGHAIEKLLNIPHGAAISAGMIIACMLSEQITGLGADATNALRLLLTRYHLPVWLSFDASEVMDILKMDKKRKNDRIDFILLDKIGSARIESLPFDVIYDTLIEYLHAGDH